MPWQYVPHWIMVTTPKLYIFAFVAGVLLLLWNFVKNPVKAFQVKQNQYYCVSLAWVTAPLLSVIVLKSIMYDGWRHMFFIYPAIVLIAARGLQFAWRLISKTRFSGVYPVAVTAFFAVLLLELISVAKFMIKHHPHQNVYFTKLTGESLGSMREHYEMDYWGVSYRQALEYILDVDKSAQITIKPANAPGIFNQDMMPVEERKRLKFLDPGPPSLPGQPFDYFITNYRWHPSDYTELKKVHAIKVNGAEIMGVYRMQ